MRCLSATHAYVIIGKLLDDLNAAEPVADGFFGDPAACQAETGQVAGGGGKFGGAGVAVLLFKGDFGARGVFGRIRHGRLNPEYVRSGLTRDLPRHSLSCASPTEISDKRLAFRFARFLS